MTLLGHCDGSEIWFGRVERPYQFSSPFGGKPFAAMLVAFDWSVQPDEMVALTDSLLEQGCRYAVCAGTDCEAWHDAVDQSLLIRYPDGDIPNDRFVVTTWHESEPLPEVASFLLTCTSIDDSRPSRFLGLSLGGGADSDAQVQQALLDQVRPSEDGAV